MNHYFTFITPVILWSFFAFGGIIHVPQDQPSIQAGINAATNGDTVLVADSTYYENINFNGKAITVASYYIMDEDTNHINNTIINGSQPSHPDSGSVVFFISGEDTTSVIYGLTITGGTGTFYVPYSSQAGGGIFCNSSGCKILTSKIINNTATGPSAYGGGLATVSLSYTAYVVLKDNQIMHNTITANSDEAWGGGVALRSNVILVIVESNKITHNSVVSHSTTSVSAFGGGVTIWGCQGRFTKNEVGHNELWVNSDRDASGAGMEIVEVPSSFIIEGNIINENAVTQGTGWGGGIFVINASPTLINNIIDGNSATNGGGGGVLIGGNSAVKFINNTVINNQATTGGGIKISYPPPPSNNYLVNSVIWGNQAPISAGIHIVLGDIHVAYSDIQDTLWPGTGNINLNPQIVADSLSNTSPCIGAGIDVYDFGSGTVLYCPPEDINGRARPYPAGSMPDMGVWESKLGTPIGIEPQLVAEIPKSYALSQNYPNPFNSTTNIQFSIPKSEFVTLKVYNILGEEVTTLVSEKLNAGKYKYEWDAGGLASGVYFYKFETSDFTQTKKLLLLR